MLTGKFDSIGKAWLELLAKMASQAAAAQIGRWLFGDFGTSNKIGGLFGDIFSGAVKWATGGSAGLSFGSEFNLASGGRVDPGSAYWVGERGPEPFFPDVAGTVISRSDLGGGSSKPPNVNVVIKHDPSMRVEKEQTDTRFDGESYHATVSLKLLKNNESYRRSMSRYLSGGR
jgi:hypothetical protein